MEVMRLASVFGLQGIPRYLLHPIKEIIQLIGSY